MGLFGRKKNDEELRRLRDQVRQLSRRVDATDGQQTELTTQLRRVSATTDQIDELQQRIDALNPPSAVTDPDDPLTDGPDLDGSGADQTPVHPLPAPTQRVSIADQAVIDELRLRLDRIERDIHTVDERVTQTSTELANQIIEISGDISVLSDRHEAQRANDKVHESTVEALQTAQQRLANEQARYQIAFRQDLAKLADRFNLDEE